MSFLEDHRDFDPIKSLSSKNAASDSSMVLFGGIFLKMLVMWYLYLVQIVSFH